MFYGGLLKSLKTPELSLLVTVRDNSETARRTAFVGERIDKLNHGYTERGTEQKQCSKETLLQCVYAS